MGTNPVYRIIGVRTAQTCLWALLGRTLLHWPLTGPHAVGLWLTSGLCIYFVFVFVGEWTWGLPILARLPPAEEGVALTFDDGPSDVTACILDVLQRYQARATFFVLGERVAERPDLVRRIISEGHALGLHGLSHDEMVLPSCACIQQDTRTALALLRTAAPHAPPIAWMRPPHGFKSLTLPFIIHRMGLQMAAWSVNARDYHYFDPRRISDKALQKIKPGAIVLLHDGPSNGVTAAALPLLLEELQARGLHTVVMPSPQSALPP